MREPSFEIATGKKGVGKSTFTRKFIDYYLLKQKRKVLIYDVNYPKEKTYSGVRIVAPEDVGKLEKIEIRRVVGLRNGVPQGAAGLKEMFLQILDVADGFQDGLMVLEDINRYITDFTEKAVIDALTTNRHKDLDVIIHLQSLNAMRPRLWSNVTQVRFHAQSDDISTYRDRITNFQLFKIAELIVNKQCRAGNIRYFVWVQKDKEKIVGANIAQFKQAVKDYFKIMPAEYRRHAMFLGLKPEAKNLEEVTEFFISEYPYVK